MSIRRRIQTSCEIRSTKSETNLSHGLNTDETLIELFAFPCFVRVSSVAQICFGFRISCFGFLSEVEFHDILVMQHVIAFDRLAVVNSGSPNTGGLETGREIAMDQGGHLDQCASGRTGERR